MGKVGRKKIYNKRKIQHQSENLQKHKKSAENWAPFLIELENEKEYLKIKKICLKAFGLFKMGCLDVKTRRKLFQIFYLNQSQKKLSEIEFSDKSSSHHLIHRTRFCPVILRKN